MEPVTLIALALSFAFSTFAYARVDWCDRKLDDIEERLERLEVRRDG